MNDEAANAFRALADHVLAMEGDVFLDGHPEWETIVADARTAINLDAGDVLCCDYKTCPHTCTEDDPCSACVGRGDCTEGHQTRVGEIAHKATR